VSGLEPIFFFLNVIRANKYSGFSETPFAVVCWSGWCGAKVDKEVSYPFLLANSLGRWFILLERQAGISIHHPKSPMVSRETT
jgi:hypothetical protein